MENQHKGWQRGQDHDGLLDDLDDCAEESGRLYFAGEEPELADAIDSHLTRADEDDDDGR